MDKRYLNKKIILVMPKFFGYEIVIKDRLEKLGASVYLVYEDMDEVNYFYRFVNAYFSKHMKQLMDRYFHRKLDRIIGEADYFLLIRGEFVSKDLMKMLKEKAADKCKFYMYQWDSANNNKNSLSIKDYFDVVSTFDQIDAEKYGWNYRPLFYIPEYVNTCKVKYDLLYLCSLHSKRVEILNSIKNICRKNQWNLYKRIYSKKVIFLKRKYLDRRKSYLIADNDDINSKKMSIEETYRLYNESRIVVDYTHPNQNGYTMRTIEAIGCRKKLITNNIEIMKADFYNSNNIYIYDENNVFIPEDFVISDYKNYKEDIYYYYSIDGWLSDILPID